MERPAKRACDDSNSIEQDNQVQVSTEPAATEPAAPMSSDLAAALDGLEPQSHLPLLREAAMKYPDIAQLVTAKYEEEVKKRNASIIRFNYLIVEASKVLNPTHSSVSPPVAGRDYVQEQGEEAVLAVKAILDKILSQVCVGSHYKTKVNAPTTYRDIFGYMLNSVGNLGDVVRQSNHDEFADNLAKLVSMLTPQDVPALAEEDNWLWTRDWEYLDMEAKDVSIDDLGISDLLGLLIPRVASDVEDDYEGDDEEDDKDEQMNTLRMTTKYTCSIYM
ncbi:hypothetical protein QBC43DRAFT_329464 [Cladorrhinum sp. PSN259]|nr:hypothetical protein QBC43DRAFT_329464 [Cladorrhinum sp. PSN259]